MTDEEKRKLLMNEFGQNTADLVGISGGWLKERVVRVETAAEEIQNSGPDPLLCEEMDSSYGKLLTSLQLRSGMAKLIDEEDFGGSPKLKPLIDKWDKSTFDSVEEKIAPARSACTSTSPSVKPK